MGIGDGGSLSNTHNKVLIPREGDALEAGVPSSVSLGEAYGVDVGGGGASSYSLDNCDQVSKNEPSTDKTDLSSKVIKQALVDALVACGRDGEADKVDSCGEDFKVGKCLDCGCSPAFPVTCDHRLCPRCAARRGKILVSEHEEILKQIRYPKMLTLTFLSVDHLDKGVDHLDKGSIKWARNCFRKLRRRKVMASCWGGIYSFEATYTKGVGWHLHIHALLGSGYIDQGDLSTEWERISGACVVDIRAIHGKDKWDGIREVVKYPAKASTFLAEPNLVNEFLIATERVNLAYGFGALYRVKTKRHAEGKMRCPLCGGMSIIFDRWNKRAKGMRTEGGYGFLVPKIAVERVKGGYLWRPPPSPSPLVGRRQ